MLIALWDEISQDLLLLLAATAVINSDDRWYYLGRLSRRPGRSARPGDLQLRDRGTERLVGSTASWPFRPVGAHMHQGDSWWRPGPGGKFTLPPAGGLTLSW